MNDIQEAIKQAVQTEKNAMNFYQLGAGQLQNEQARSLFTQLAKEEREHASHFFGAYTGSDLGTFAEFMDAPPVHDAVWFSSIQRVLSPDFTAQAALELAMEKESVLEKALRDKAAGLGDHQGREIFEHNARETHNHYLTIEAEYARLMAMVDESDMDTFVRE